MGIHLYRRAARLGAATLLVGALTLGSVTVVFADNGNNGTVKVQEGVTDPVTQNEPQVCTFHAAFLFGDPGQAGNWSVNQVSPTGSAQVLSGSYVADANGSFSTGEYGLPIGHYALNWDGRDDQNQKHKTFWITCDNGGGGGGGG